MTVSDQIIIEDKEINGFKINPIGVGTWKMGGHITPSILKHKDAEEISAIKYSMEHGQNHIDTAELYGAGKAEKLVAQAIRGFGREKLYIASKIWSHHRKRKAVKKGVSKILERLQTDYLDLIYIHFPWSMMEDYMAGLNDVVDEGLAKGVAVSNFNLEQLKKAQDLSKNKILANQVLYSVYKRSVVTDELLEFCKQNNIRIVAYTPIEDIFSGNRDNALLKELAEKYVRTMAQIAINWLIIQENVVTIPKATSKKHIDDNLGALEFELEEEDFERLKEIGEYSDKIW